MSTLLLILALAGDGPNDWFLKELPNREKRLSEEFLKGRWRFFLVSSSGDQKDWADIDWKEGRGSFVLKKLVSRAGVPDESIIVRNPRYSFAIQRNPDLVQGARTTIFKPTEKVGDLESHLSASPGRQAFYVSKLLGLGENSPRRFQLLNVERKTEREIPRIVATFRDDLKLKGKPTLNRRQVITYREDLGWALERIDMFALLDGKESLTDSVRLVYDTKQGKRADLALTQVDRDLEYPIDGKPHRVEERMSVVERDPNFVLAEEQARMSAFGLPEPTLSDDGIKANSKK